MADGQFDYRTNFHTELTSGSSPGSGGRIFYIDPSAAAGGNGSTPSTAWNSWDQLASFAQQAGFQPGDTILLKRGFTYDSNSDGGFWFHANGSADKPVTVGAYGDGSPPVLINSHFVPDAAGNDSSINDAVLNIDQSSSHIIIRDLKIDNPTYPIGNVTDAGIRVFGTDVTIDNVEIANSGTGVWFGRNATSGTGAPSEIANGLVQNCYIHDLRMVKNTIGGNDDYGCIGVLVMASNVTVVHNSFDHLSAPSYDYGWDGSTVELYGSVHNVRVTGNYIENVNAVTEAGGVSSDSVSDIWFDHNIVVNAESMAYFHNGGGQFGLGSIANVNFLANTVYGTGNRSDSVSFAFGFGGPDGSFLTVKDNIFAMQALDYWNVGAGNFQHSHNLYDIGSVPFPTGYFASDEYLGAAGFVDPQARDFRLQSISAAMGRAEAIAGFLRDYVGHDLTGRSGLDIGAIEYWSGSQIFGTNISETLAGTSADDEIMALGGDDILIGGAGADRLDGGAGYDRMYGGTGNDIYYVSDSKDIVYENAGEGIDRVVATVDQTLRAEVEELEFAGTANLKGYGNALSNLMLGNDGGNLLYGRDGNDRISGNAGNDIIYGENGNDALIGGSGQDQFYGGTGADTFIFADGDFAGMSTSGSDRIHDFTVGLDHIDLSAVDANRGLAGDQAFNFIGSGAFTGVAGELRFQQISGNCYVQGDTNGDGVADFWLRLDGQQLLHASDFLI